MTKKAGSNHGPIHGLLSHCPLLVKAVWLQTDAEASIYQRYNLVHTGRAQFLTLSGGDILYVSQLESQLTAPLFHRMTLGTMVARLGAEGAPPTKVRTIL